MAEDSAPAMDMEERRSTYQGFVKLTTWSVVGIAVLLILMAIFLL